MFENFKGYVQVMYCSQTGKELEFLFLNLMSPIFD